MVPDGPHVAVVGCNIWFLIVPDDPHMVHDGSYRVPDGPQVVTDDPSMVPDDLNMIPDDPRVVPNGSNMVPDGPYTWSLTGS